MRASAMPGSTRRVAFATLRMALLGAALFAMASAGCNTIPGMSTAWTVQSVAQRGPYLDATLVRGGEQRRYFLPASEACGGMLRPEASLELVSLGPMGQLQAGEAVCDPLGIGSLREWRESRARPTVGPIPSRQATFRLDYEDAELVMLRGRFPLVGLIGFPGLGDTLVAIPQTDACRPLRQATVASIEYRVAGPDPYVLIAGELRCPVHGLIQPISPR
jgi:hypothetical protein